MINFFSSFLFNSFRIDLKYDFLKVLCASTNEMNDKNNLFFFQKKKKTNKKINKQKIFNSSKKLK